MSGNRVCWNRGSIAYATQVDVGGLEVGDQHADAVFSAIHQPLPLHRARDAASTQYSETTQDSLLKLFVKPIDSNEPRLVFITGHRGTGKSHLVRWLKSQIGMRPTWHVVYIEKRNTNLRRVIERILAGIDSPRAHDLRKALATASAEISTDEEAMSALVGRMHHLVTFDQAYEVNGLGDLAQEELADLRAKANRLLGDFTFRQELCRPGGPIHRIVRLATGTADETDADPEDLHISEQDLMVQPDRFEDAGQPMQTLVRSVIGNKPMRTDIAALCDAYLERAKSDVFTGPSMSLLEVFEDVRREIASRGHELCLLVEDLVLLHGIDKQLAQALTIPATSELCRLRAAIAVTDGYLASVDTFADRGIHFKINLDLNSIGHEQLREFVGRYLNVGRLADDQLVGDDGPSKTSKPVNACKKCPDRGPCHDAFGASQLGHGYYPFNGPALDRLIDLASDGEFRPRAILREVIRDPLEVAEEELPRSGVFPSGDFARTLDEHRKAVPFDVQNALARNNPISPDAELSLRAFYSTNPPTVDEDVRRIAAYLDVTLSTSTSHLDEDEPARVSRPAQTQPNRRQASPAATKQEAQQPQLDVFHLWATDQDQLPSPIAHAIRVWICETTIGYLMDGPYGLAISKSGRSWRIGGYDMRTTDVWIEDAAGSGGGLPPENPFEIKRTKDNAELLRGVYKAQSGMPLDAEANGLWYFLFQTRIARYADKIAIRARAMGDKELTKMTRTLTVLRHASSIPGNTLKDALPSMLKVHASTSPSVSMFLKQSKPYRDQALIALREHVTTSKGVVGDPSIVDIGLVYGEINKHLRDRSFLRDTEEGIEGLDVLQERLEQAAAKAWAEVDNLLTLLSVVIAPDENLSATSKKLKQLLEAGAVLGRLAPNLKADYEEAEMRVTSAQMDLYSKLVRVAPAKDLWELKEDPDPALRSLLHYATTANRLLVGLEASLASVGTDAVMIDLDGLTDELRGLARALDDVSVKRGK